MNYNSQLQEYNERIRNILLNFGSLTDTERNFSFADEELITDIKINCEKPKSVVVTSDIKKSGQMQQLPTHLFPGATEIGSARWGDYIYLFGGWTRERNGYLAEDIQRYNIKTGMVEQIKTTLPINTSGALTITYNDAIYVIGGYQKSDPATTIFKFDPITETITTLGISLPVGIVNGTGVLVGDGIVYVTSGCREVNNTNQGLDKIIKIDLKNNKVEQFAYGINTPCYYTAEAVYGSKQYIIGGKTSEGTELNLIQWFDFETLEVGTLTTKLPKNIFATKAVIVDDLIYVVGGASGSSSLKTIYIFNPNTAEISLFPQTTPWTAGYIAVESVDNTIFVFGGGGSDWIIAGKMTPYCFTPYPEGTCIIKIGYENPDGETLYTMTHKSINTYGYIEKVFLTTSSGIQEVTWTNKGASHSNAQYKNPAFNFGTEESTSQGYIRSSQFNNIKEVIVTNQVPRIENITYTEARVAELGGLQGTVAYGKCIYTFGGWYPVTGNSAGDVSNKISKYDTETKTLTVLSAKMPTTCSGSSCAKIGNKIYIFGGYRMGGKILCFDPTTEANPIDTNLRLPHEWLNGCVAAWGDEVYLLGGRGQGYASSEIIYINIRLGIVSTLDITLPVATYYAGFAQVGNRVYLAGGTTDSGLSNVIQYFDRETMTTGIFKQMSHTMENPICSIVDNYFYVSGYTGGTPYLHRINLLNGEQKALGYRLSKGILLGGYATIGDTLYIMGGRQPGAVYTETVSEYQFKPAVSENAVLFHTDINGTYCAPCRYNGLSTEIVVDKIYKGSTLGWGNRVTDAQAYYNNEWKSI